jgi:hypothetical protein
MLLFFKFLKSLQDVCDLDKRCYRIKKENGRVSSYMPNMEFHGKDFYYFYFNIL